MGSTRVWIAAIMIAWSSSVWGSDGYRVVLASFPTFDEAKSKMERLGEQLGENERSLQRQIDYEIVARPSGKSYIIGIEPIGSKAEQEKVLKAFRTYYRDAYGDKYHGPTEGTIVLGGNQQPSATNMPAKETKETAITERQSAETPIAASGISEAVMEPLDSADAERATMENPQHSGGEAALQRPDAESGEPDEDSYYGLYEGGKEWAWALAAITMLFVASVVWIRTFKWENSHDEHDAQEHGNASDVSHSVDIPDTAQEELFEIDTEELPDEEEKEEVDNIVGNDDTQSENPEEDIFHRLKKNPFFITVIEQLQEAADANEATRCIDLMEEVRRYQKNFRNSPIIDRMDELIRNRETGELSALIAQVRA